MTPLPHEGLLSTLAEMSIAVVGFSMVVGILKARSPYGEDRLFTLRDVAEIGLICTVMSAFPLVVHAYGTPTNSVWRISSAVQGVWAITSVTGSFLRRGPAILALLRQHWFLFGVVFGLAFVNLALVMMNVATPSSLSGARYVSCMLLGLTQAGFMFLLAAFDIGNAKGAA